MVFDQRVESNALSERSESKGYHYRNLNAAIRSRQLAIAAYSLGTSTFILVGGQ